MYVCVERWGGGGGGGGGGGDVNDVASVCMCVGRVGGGGEQCCLCVYVYLCFGWMGGWGDMSNGASVCMCVLGGEGNVNSVNVCWLLSGHIFDVCRRAAGSVLYRRWGSAGTATSAQLNTARQLWLCGTLLWPDGWAHWEKPMFMIMTEDDDQW